MPWTFASNVITQANEAAQNITAVASITTGGSRFTCSAHGYAAGDLVQIDGTADYDGIYYLDAVAADTFDIPELTFTSSQAGTVALGDGDLSELAGLTGITVSGSVYTVDSTRRIIVTGAFTLVPEENILQFEDGDSGSFPRMEVNDDAYFRFGGRSVVGDTTVYSKGVGLIVLGSGGSIWDTGGNGAFSTTSGNPTLEFFGGVMVLGKPISFGGLNRQGSSNDHLGTGPVTIEDLTVRMTSGGQIRFDNDETAIINVSNIRFHGNSNILLFAEGFTTFSAIFDNVILQSYGGQLVALRFDDLALLNNQADDDMQTNRGGEVLLFVNSDKGSSASITIKNTTACHLAFFGTALIEALAQDGTALEDIKYRIVDTVRDNRVTPIGTFATDFPELAIPYGVSTATVYNGMTDANGEAAPDILMSTFSADASEATRRSDYSNGGSLGDSFDINMFGYGTVYAMQSAVLRTRGGTPIPFFLGADASITESDKATVDAYAELDTSAKVYDRLKSYLYNNYAGETEPYVTLSDDTLDFDDADIALNATGTIVVVNTAGAVTLNVGDTFTGNIVTTGTVTVHADVTVDGSITDSAGISFVFTGLPHGSTEHDDHYNHHGVVRCWPASQGVNDRTNEVIGEVADEDATTITVTLAADTEYNYVADALGYRRSPVAVINTTNQTTAMISLEQIVDAQGNELIPHDLSTSETAEAGLVEWAADYIDVDADGTNDEISYNAMVYAVEQGQSTAAACGSLLHPARIEVGRIVIPATSDQKWRAKATLTDTTKIPDLQSTGIFKDGAADQEEYIDFSNGPVKVKTEAPVFANITGANQEDFHDYLENASDTIKGGYKADVTQDTFDARMAAVPGATKDTYKGSGGSGGSLDQSTFDTRMANVPGSIKDTYKGSGGSSSYSETNLHMHLDNYTSKDDWKADVGGIDGKINTIDTVVDGIQTDLSNNTDGLGVLLSGLNTIDGKIDTIDTVADGIQSDLDNGTDGLGALVGKLDTIDGKVDSIPTEDTYSQNVLHTDLDAYVNKDDWKANVSGIGGGSLDQATFDVRMLAVPDTTKDLFKGTGASGYTEANLHSHLDSYTNKVDFKADVSGITFTLTTIDGKVNIIDTVVDGIQADIDNSTDGLGALKNLLDAIPTDVMDQATFESRMAGVSSSTKDDFKAEVSLLSDGTNGLAALKSALNTISGYTDILDDGTDGLTAIRTAINSIPTSSPSAADIASAVGYSQNALVSAIQAMDASNQAGTQTLAVSLDNIKAVVEDNNSHLENASYGLSAIQTAVTTIDAVVDANKVLLEDGSSGTAALKGLLETITSYVDTVENTLGNSTYGLAALQILIDALPTDTPPSASTIAEAVRDIEVVTNCNLLETLRILLSIGGGKIVTSNSNIKIYRFADANDNTSNLVLTIPKFVGDNRAGGGTIP